MNKIKSSLKYFVILFIVGLVILILGIVKDGNTVLSVIGLVYMALSILKFVQIYKLSKNKEKLKQYEISQSEERVIFLAKEARNLVFITMTVLECAGGFALLVMGEEVVSRLLLGLVSLQIILYLVFYWYVCKKY